MFRDGKLADTERDLATHLLAEYTHDRPDALAEFLLEADPAQFEKILPKLRTHGDRAVTLLNAELAKTVTPHWADAPLDPAWAVPDPALMRQFEDAQGMLADRFALCQTLPLERFERPGRGITALRLPPCPVPPLRG